MVFITLEDNRSTTTQAGETMEENLNITEQYLMKNYQREKLKQDQDFNERVRESNRRDAQWEKDFRQRNNILYTRWLALAVAVTAVLTHVLTRLAS